MISSLAEVPRGAADPALDARSELPSVILAEPPLLEVWEPGVEVSAAQWYHASRAGLGPFGPLHSVATGMP